MFAKTIIDSDAFLDMPLSTQALYFHLSMRADDDGFINNPKKVQRMIGCADDDLKLLILKKFIIPFDSGIVVIKHWKIHNYIRKDRYNETVYQNEKGLLTENENGSYSLMETFGIPLDNQDDTQRLPQVRLGKDRIGKVSIEEDTPSSSKPKKDKYGEFEKVSLTEDEYSKLIEKLGQSLTDDFITRLDSYKASTGKTYKSDYATILNWSRKEPVKTTLEKPQQKPNKFHNFNQNIASMGESKLEEMARRKMESFNREGQNK